ncbi:hypothetical protein HPB52_012871 [Rhipicephalus sanguineus]|uniref:Uncharacterized protein n=1 Tax=Rhipicephalus sanguineus TaxID=34632 RepID=A0A9D4T091_RHISA|nr:hypothetical protein HPB52_012871 [Rhipicephalus sanguineus]
MFCYRSEEPSFAQKNGCVHGEELSCMLGLPLLGSGAPLYVNYSKEEAALSETTKSYSVCFFRTDPGVTLLDTKPSKELGITPRASNCSYWRIHEKYKHNRSR